MLGFDSLRVDPRLGLTDVGGSRWDLHCKRPSFPRESKISSFHQNSISSIRSLHVSMSHRMPAQIIQEFKVQ